MGDGRRAREYFGARIFPGGTKPQGCSNPNGVAQIMGKTPMKRFRRAA